MSSTAIVAGSELLIAILQAYFIAAEQSKMTAEQAKEYFDANYEIWMAKSSTPVEPVNE